MILETDKPRGSERRVGTCDVVGMPHRTTREKGRAPLFFLVKMLTTSRTVTPILVPQTSCDPRRSTPSETPTPHYLVRNQAPSPTPLRILSDTQTGYCPEGHHRALNAPGGPAGTDRSPKRRVAGGGELPSLLRPRATARAELQRLVGRRCMERVRGGGVPWPGQRLGRCGGVSG